MPGVMIQKKFSGTSSISKLKSYGWYLQLNVASWECQVPVHYSLVLFIGIAKCDNRFIIFFDISQAPSYI